MTCPAHQLAASRQMLVKEDVDLIRSLVKKLPDDSVTVVDLGAGSGTSALSVFAERESAVTIYGIDYEEDVLNWASKAVENIGREADWVPVVGDIGEIPEIGKVDLLLLDVNGDTETILRRWLPVLSPQAYIWVHDYGKPRDFGLNYDPQKSVKQGIDLLVKEKLIDEVEISGLGWGGQVHQESKAPAEKPARKTKSTPKEDDEGDSDRGTPKATDE